MTTLTVEYVPKCWEACRHLNKELQQVTLDNIPSGVFVTPIQKMPGYWAKFWLGSEAPTSGFAASASVVHRLSSIRSADDLRASTPERAQYILLETTKKASNYHTYGTAVSGFTNQKPAVLIALRMNVDVMSTLERLLAEEERALWYRENICREVRHCPEGITIKNLEKRK